VEFVFDQGVADLARAAPAAFSGSLGAAPPHHRQPQVRDHACLRPRSVVQRAYAECAEGYSVQDRSMPPADPAKKGIVEAGVKYREGQLSWRPAPSVIFADLNAQARRCHEEAGIPIHGTTRERPLELFAVEKSLMLPLPAVAPDSRFLATGLILHRDCHVKFNYSLYSAPFSLAGSPVVCVPRI